MRRQWVWAAAMWAIAGSTGCDTAEELAAGEPSPDAAPLLDAGSEGDGGAEADAALDAGADVDASQDASQDADASSDGDAEASVDADGGDGDAGDEANDGSDAQDASDETNDASDETNDASDETNDASDQDALVPTYASDVKPIFAAKCTPCHTGLGSGGHDMGSSYDDTQLDSYYCPGKKKGECSIVRIHDGSMPQGAGCTGDPTTDASKPACTTAAQQATITVWIAGGMQP